jgi:protein TonB
VNISDHLVSFLFAVLLHVLGLLLIGHQVSSAPPVVATVPELDMTSVELSLADAETDSPSGSQNPESKIQNPESLALPIPEPVEPEPPEELPDKPDFTEALTQPPPTPQPQPSPVVISQPAPSPAPPAVLRPPPAARRPPSSSPASSGPQATLQTVGAGGGAYGRVDGHPSLERAIKPNYPIGSRRRGEEGTVILDVTVTGDGRAANVSLISSSGFPDLDRAAERAAVQARFKPGTRDGKPVESAARLTLIFRLRDS